MVSTQEKKPWSPLAYPGLTAQMPNSLANSLRYRRVIWSVRFFNVVNEQVAASEAGGVQIPHNVVEKEGASVVQPHEVARGIVGLQ